MRRSAALPVGAARSTRGSGAPAAAAWRRSSASTTATVRVLPVPGPPVMTQKRVWSAVRAASRWPATRSGFCAGSSAARSRSSSFGSSSGGGGGDAGADGVGELPLVAPVAVQVEPAALQDERARAAGLADGAAGEQRGGVVSRRSSGAQLCPAERHALTPAAAFSSGALPAPSSRAISRPNCRSSGVELDLRRFRLGGRAPARAWRTRAAPRSALIFRGRGMVR